MGKKEVLVYFSDCAFFAGCENMIPNFLDSKSINNSYEVYFFYRKSEAYSVELENRLLNSKDSKNQIQESRKVFNLWINSDRNE